MTSNMTIKTFRGMQNYDFSTGQSSYRHPIEFTPDAKSLTETIAPTTSSLNSMMAAAQSDCPRSTSASFVHEAQEYPFYLGQEGEIAPGPERIVGFHDVTRELVHRRG
jgi:hypothetical protein